MAANTKTYKIDGMDCAHCAQTITNGVSKFPGVHNVEVDFIGGTLKFEGEVAPDTLRQRIEALGYKMAEPEARAGLRPAPTNTNNYSPLTVKSNTASPSSAARSSCSACWRRCSATMPPARSTSSPR
ncbi:MAG: heavy metal-associated domain-containing protein [Anaerolineae bacterium]